MTHNHSGSASLDLNAIAHQAMVAANFVPDLSPAVLEQLRMLPGAAEPAAAVPSRRDLRRLLWSSIDDCKSRDLDQVEYAESLPNGNIRLLVGIADVDEFVPNGSSID